MITSNESEIRTSFAPAFSWSGGEGEPTAPVVRAPILRLTQAEMRVMALIRQGLSNKEISSVLGRAEPTIKHQVSACLKKYQVPSRSRLIAVAR